MTTLWRFLKVFVLGTWVGSIIFFVLATAVLFSQLKNIDQAGNIVAVLIVQLHLLGIIAAVIYLIVALIAALSWRGLVRPASILVELMLLATLFLQLWVVPTMQNLRAQMGSYANTAANSPLRQQFDHFHVISMWIETGVLIAGIVALFLTVWQRTHRLGAPPAHVSGPVTGSTAPPAAIPPSPTHRIT